MATPGPDAARQRAGGTEGAAATATGLAPLVSVVVPTYREAANIPLLVPRVSSALREAGLEHEIVIVDDNSRDGSEEAVAELSRNLPVRILVRRHERGLATAVLYGLREARGRVLVSMDADLSHPPEAVPRLARAIIDGADFAMGSRYIPGASIDEAWTMFRWLNSKVALMMAKPLTPASDSGAGFFAISRAVLDAADPLDPVGYKVALELLVKAPIREMVEVPIHFADRKHGQSKLSLKQQVLYLRHLARLAKYRLGKRGKKRPRLVRLGTGPGCNSG